MYSWARDMSVPVVVANDLHHITCSLRAPVM